MTHAIVDYLLSGIGLTTFGGGVIWAVRQQSRINEHDLLFVEREKQDESRDKRTDERHEETKAWLARIETKLDDVISRA